MKLPTGVRHIKGLPKGTKVEAYGIAHYDDIVIVGPHRNGVEVTGNTVVGKSRVPFDKGSCFHELALVKVLK